MPREQPSVRVLPSWILLFFGTETQSVLVNLLEIQADLDQSKIEFRTTLMPRYSRVF